MSGEKWLSIVEYSNFKKLSISTIRRYIKAGRLKYKAENGKYFILCQNANTVVSNNGANDQMLVDLQNEVNSLKEKLVAVAEENQELKMLVQLYEKQLEKKSNNLGLPEIPSYS
jgi:predicted site-specific integrase-resolvase